MELCSPTTLSLWLQSMATLQGIHPFICISINQPAVNFVAAHMAVALPTASQYITLHREINSNLVDILSSHQFRPIARTRAALINLGQP